MSTSKASKNLMNAEFAENMEVNFDQLRAAIDKLETKIDKVQTPATSSRNDSEIVTRDLQLKMNKMKKESVVDFGNFKSGSLSIQKLIMNDTDSLSERNNEIEIVLYWIYHCLSSNWQDSIIPPVIDVSETMKNEKANSKSSVKMESNDAIIVKPENKNAKDIDIIYLCDTLKILTKCMIRLDDNIDLLWLIVPTHRYLFELLQCISYFIISKDRHLTQDSKVKATMSFLSQGGSQLKSKLLPIIEDIKTVPEISVYTRLTKAVALSLEKLFAEHVKDIAASTGLIVVGAVTSLVTMKVSGTLLTGLSRAAAAAFDIFQHCKANQQIEILNTLIPSRLLKEPIISYSQLVKASKNISVVKGNWLLTSAYINNLLKIVFCAHQHLSNDNDDDNNKDSKEGQRIINACIYGDTNVIGLLKLYKQVSRKKTCDPVHRILSSILDGSSLSELLRNTGVEALGEILEVLNDFSKEKIEKLQESLTRIDDSFLSCFKDSKTFSCLSEKERESRLAIVSGVLSLLKWFQDMMTRLNKCFNRCIQAMKGSWNLCNAISQYFHMFGYIVNIDATENDNSIITILTKSQNENIFEELWNYVNHSNEDDLPKSKQNDHILLIRKLCRILAILTWCFGTIQSKLIGTQKSIFREKESKSSYATLIRWPTLNDEIQKLEKIVEQIHAIPIDDSMTPTIGDTPATAGKKGKNEEKTKKEKEKSQGSSWMSSVVGSFNSVGTHSNIELKGDYFSNLLIKLNDLDFINSFLKNENAELHYELPGNHPEIPLPPISLLSKTSNIFTIVIGFSDKVCELFDTAIDILEFPGLKSKATILLKDLKNEIRSEINKYLSVDIGDGWFKTLNETWQACNSVISSTITNGAMNMVREGLITLVGPGARPELVEETILSTMLELEMILSKDQNTEIELISEVEDNIANRITTESITTVTVEDKEDSLADHHQKKPIKASSSMNITVKKDIMKILQSLQMIIAKSKASTSNSNILLLLNQSTYHTKAIDFLQRYWHSIENDLLLHKDIGIQSQKDLHDRLHITDIDTLSKGPEFLTFAKQIVQNDPMKESLNTMIIACDQASKGIAGLSGVVTALRYQLISNQKEMELRSIVMIQKLEKAEAKAKFGDPLYGTSNRDEFQFLFQQMELLHHKLNRLDKRTNRIDHMLSKGIRCQCPCHNNNPNEEEGGGTDLYHEFLEEYDDEEEDEDDNNDRKKRSSGRKSPRPPRNSNSRQKSPRPTSSRQVTSNISPTVPDDTNERAVSPSNFNGTFGKAPRFFNTPEDEVLSFVHFLLTVYCFFFFVL
jgi:hypothetical protein